MRKFTWITHTNISTKDYKPITFELTPYLETFINNEIWNKQPYRTEYSFPFAEKQFKKIKSFNITIYSEGAPISQFHRFEIILAKHISLESIEKIRLYSSGIPDAKKLAIIEIEFESDFDVFNPLTYDDEKDIDKVMGHLNNSEAWYELRDIKTIICEILQFFEFNLHLNFLTQNYTFSTTEKPELSGLTFVTDGSKIYYETDKIDLLSHYILYEKETDRMTELMSTTSHFWCQDITPIYFFIDALKGNYITSTNFIKLVFTIESFFPERISADFMSLVIPLILGHDIEQMKDTRSLLRKCFSIRNEIVHGGTVHGFRDIVSKNGAKGEKSVDDYFYKLKNMITELFYFYTVHNLFKKGEEYRLTHEIIFSLIPDGINK